jgi:predicted alpha/beta hydrolase
MRPDRSLVEALHQAGFDVYLLCHRGDPDALPPARPQAFDFDDLVAKDLQAALDAIRSRCRAQRVLFVGHGLGGLLFVAHLARSGQRDLAAGVTLCSPVQFDTSPSRAREVHRIARLLPARWAIPHRAIQRCLLATGRDATLQRQAQQVDGPTLRRLALDQTSDLSAGLMQQIARWHTVGHLSDREDRFDDVAALRGVRFALLSITADADPSCSPAAAAPLTAAICGSESRTLSGGWGHLDPIVGTAASREVFPGIVDWLNPHRPRCWDRDM